MTTRVVIRRPALVALLYEPPAQAVLDVAAAATVSQVEDESPVETGAFQDSIRSRRYPLSRRIYSRDPFAHLIEWGSKNNMPYAPFRRAARALGFRLVEAEKEVTFVARDGAGDGDG